MTHGLPAKCADRHCRRIKAREQWFSRFHLIPGIGPISFSSCLRISIASIALPCNRYSIHQVNLAHMIILVCVLSWLCIRPWSYCAQRLPTPPVSSAYSAGIKYSGQFRSHCGKLCICRKPLNGKLWNLLQMCPAPKIYINQMRRAKSKLIFPCA